MTKIYDLVQWRAKQVVQTVVARLTHRSPPAANLAVEGITNRTNQEIQKRKKTRLHTTLSCKIDYLLTSNHHDRSTTCQFLTDDYRGR